MRAIDALQPKRAIRRSATAVGLAMVPVLAWAQTVATAASGQSPTIQPGSGTPFYHGVRMMGSWGPGYYGSGMMGGFWLFWVLLCLLVIVGGIVFLILGASVCRHRYGCRVGASAPESAALRILEERYARGDIERDEYLKKRADLGK